VQIPLRTTALIILILSELTALRVFAAAQGQSAEQLYNEANSAYDRGDVPRAISLYQQVVRLQPDSVPARTNLAVALAHDGGFISLAFSPDGKRIATGGANNKIVIWDVTPMPREAGLK